MSTTTERMTAAEFGDPRLPAHFWAKVRVNEESGCWEWVAMLSDKGYGRFWYDGRRVSAHRISYAALVGDLPAWTPAGLQLDHLCRVRACVNPAHLELVSPRVNVLRGESPTAERARRTHCVRGHRLAGANLRNKVPERHRACAKCHRLLDVARAAAIRTAHLSLGLTQRDYFATFGYSHATAERILAAVDAGTPREVILATATEGTT